MKSVNRGCRGISIPSGLNKVGSHFIAILLPIAVWPFAARPFEPIKVGILLGLVGLMSILWVYTAFRSLHKRLHLPILWDPDAARKSGSRLTKSSVLPILLLTATLVVSKVISASPEPQILGPESAMPGLTIHLVLVVMFFLILDALRTKGEVAMLVSATAAGSVPVALYGFMQFLGLDPFQWITDAMSPVLSTIGRSNYLGAYLAMLLPLTVGRMLMLADPRWKRQYAVIAVLQVACLTLTWARAALLAALVGVALALLLLMWRWRSRLLGILFILSVLIGLSAIVLTATQPYPKTATPGQEVQISGEPDYFEVREESVRQRLAIWSASLQLIRKRWLLGYGPGSFNAVISSNCQLFPDLPLSVCQTIDDPHNLLILAAFAGGLAGLSALAWLWLSFVKLLIRTFLALEDHASQALCAGILGAFVAFVIQALFNRQDVTVTVIGWLVLTAGTALSRSVGRSKCLR